MLGAVKDSDNSAPRGQSVRRGLRRVIVAAAALAVATTAVGATMFVAHAGPFSGLNDYEQINQVVRSWGKAYAGRDFDALCGIYTQETQNTIRIEAQAQGGRGYSNCPDAMRELYRGAPPLSPDAKAQYTAAALGSVETKGDDATATIKVANRCLSERFQRVDGRWYIGEWTARDGVADLTIRGTVHSQDGHFTC